MAIRIVLTVLVIVCCLLAAPRDAGRYPRTRTVTELVAVMNFPARPVNLPAPSVAAAPVADAQPIRVAVEEPPGPAAAKPALATRSVPRVAARARDKIAARTHVAQAPRRHLPMQVAAVETRRPAPVPTLFVPIRKFGYSVQRKLVDVGLLKVCRGADAESAGCVQRGG